jgi:hypothetical protein
MKNLKQRILQRMADSVIRGMQTAEDVDTLNMFMQIGFLLDFYATEQQIYLN